MNLEHIDHLREHNDKRKKTTSDAESLMEIAEGSTELIMWGPEQKVLNEPMEVCGVIDREYGGHTIFYKFYHAKILYYYLEGNIVKDGKIVNTFTLNNKTVENAEKFEVISGDVMIGRIIPNCGALILDFAKNPGDIEVYCSYEWENR